MNDLKLSFLIPHDTLLWQLTFVGIVGIAFACHSADASIQKVQLLHRTQASKLTGQFLIIN